MSYSTKKLPIHLQTIANMLVSKSFDVKKGKSANRGVTCFYLTQEGHEVVINQDGYVELFTSNRNAVVANDCGWHQLYAGNDTQARETLDFILRITGND